MTPNDPAIARVRRFVRVLAWVALPVGLVALATGILQAIRGQGSGYVTVALGVVLLAMSIIFFRVLKAVRGRE